MNGTLPSMYEKATYKNDWHNIGSSTYSCDNLNKAT